MKWMLGFVALALVACGGDGNGATPASTDSGVRIPEVRQIGDFSWLVLDGKTPYARGLQHGTALRSQIEQGVRAWREWIKRIASIEADSVVQGFLSSTGHLAAAKARAPDLVAELQGIADGAGLDLGSVFAYGAPDAMIAYLTERMPELDRGACGNHSTAVALGPAEGRHALIALSHEPPPYVDGLQTVLHIKAPGAEFQVLLFTWAGMLGVSGVNQRGVAVVRNALPGAGSPGGLPTAMIQRRILAAKDLDGALAVLHELPGVASVNYVLADPDRVVDVEKTAEGVVLTEPTDAQPFLAHTNHALASEAPSDDRDPGETRARLASAVAFLQAHEAGVTVETLEELLATRPICVEQDNGSARTRLCAVIELDPANPRMYLTAGPPRQARYREFRLFDFR